MCGLCGCYGAIGKVEKKIFSTLQVFSQLRGRDSCGLALVSFDKTKKIVIEKIVGGLEYLVYNSENNLFDVDTWELEQNIFPQCIIGHHRFATSGLVNLKNTHPFEFDNIVGCHNGTLVPHSIKNLESYDKDLVDSEIILSEINKGKPLDKIIKDVMGAWALVWWDKTDETINFCRNNERNLFLAILKTKKTIFWASESWMLQIALSRAGLNADEFDILITAADKHLVWKRINTNVTLVSSIKAETKTTIWGKGSFSWGSKKKVKPLIKKVPLKDIFEEMYAKGFGGSYIEREDFDRLTKNGCAWCTSNTGMSWEDRHEIAWYDDDQPICKVCDNYSK